MAIKKQHDLPKSAPAEVLSPVEESVFAPAIAAYLREEDPEREPKSRDYVRPSDALKCARQLGYSSAGVAPSNPIDESSLMAFTIGNYVESICEAAVRRAFPDFEHQTPLEGTLVVKDGDEIFEITVNGIADIVTDDAVGDWKSSGGFSFKKMIGVQGEAEGPKMGAVLQAGVGALMLNRPKVFVAYVGKESLSVNMAKKAHLEDKLMGRDYYEFWLDLEDIREELDAELVRMWKIVRMVHDEGELPRRMIPGVPGEILDPTTGAWRLYATNTEGERVLMDESTTWNCGYCSWQGQCDADGPGRVAVEVRPKVVSDG